MRWIGWMSRLSTPPKDDDEDDDDDEVEEEEEEEEADALRSTFRAARASALVASLLPMSLASSCDMWSNELAYVIYSLKNGANSENTSPTVCCAVQLCT
jgi:hypothetical protein